jgi:spore coat protein U-like protein
VRGATSTEAPTGQGMGAAQTQVAGDGLPGSQNVVPGRYADTPIVVTVSY